GSCRHRPSRQARKAASVLPEPVGARMSVCRPEAMAGQPCRWAAVGSPNSERNHSRTGARNGARGSGVSMRILLPTTPSKETVIVPRRAGGDNRKKPPRMTAEPASGATMSDTAPDPDAWAARQVGLSPDPTPAEVRAALLRDVTREGFVPPPERQQAWQVLCGS